MIERQKVGSLKRAQGSRRERKTLGGSSRGRGITLSGSNDGTDRVMKLIPELLPVTGVI